MKYGRYQIIKELGKGAMGVVYLAHDPRIERQIALKVLRQDCVENDDLRSRFVKEAKAIGRLSHPNIVTVFDVGQDHDTIFIAMELLEGNPLNEILSERKLSFEEIVNLAGQIAGALDYAHQRGIIHRDIKPTNIIVNPEDHVKITDFGIARFEDTSATHQTQAGIILGTPSYMSSEQVMGETIDGRSDLYSLGVILYELCTGKMPFKGSNLSAVFMAITQETPAVPVKINPSVPVSISDLILKSLSKSPDDRFQTGNDMKEALKNCLLTMEPTTGGKNIEHKPKKQLKKIGISALISLIVVCLAAGAVYLIIQGMPITKNKETTPIEVTMGSNLEKEPANITKEKKSALLDITSMPEGAEIFINGTFKGKTPLPIELELGKYDVRLSLRDYHVWEAPLEFKDEGKTPLRIPLIPMD